MIRALIEKLKDVDSVTEFKEEFLKKVQELPSEQLGETVETLCDEYQSSKEAANLVASSIKRLKEDKARLDNVADTVKTAVEMLLAGEEFISSDFSVKYRKSKALKITDFTKIPAEYYKERSEDDINKTQLKAALQQGIVIEGAEIVENANINIKSLKVDEPLA